MSSISLILALWQADVLSSEVVTSWADHEISETETPSFELIQLSLHGPQVCLEQTAENFAVIPTELSYLDLFSIHAEEALDSLQQSTKFLEWVCHHCIGEDVRFPEVAFSYHLDNLYRDCDNVSEAVKLLEEELPNLLEDCRSRVMKLISDLPNFVRKEVQSRQ